MLKRIPIEAALRDLLREYGVTVEDLLVAMMSENLDVYGELVKRIDRVTKDVYETIYSFPWRLVALTLFTLQAFYLANPSGLYKGYVIDPPREAVAVGDKVVFHGLMYLVNRLKHVLNH